VQVWIFLIFIGYYCLLLLIIVSHAPLPAREALEALDRQGWQRSFHQRLFHDYFIRACARIFWKTEPPGAFARDHQKILEVNGWDHLSQEILVSTPRRSGPLTTFSIFSILSLVAFLAEALKEPFLRLWYESVAAIALFPAPRAQEQRVGHHAVEILPLHFIVHQLCTQGSGLPCLKREPTHAAATIFWQGVGVVFHPPFPPLTAWYLADGVGGHRRRQGVP
jgi:hypothetical protein